MIDEATVEGLKKRYKTLNPLIFHRSVEKAKSASDLFDILESFPHKYPVVWSEEEHQWVNTKDLVQVTKFDLEMEHEND
jgi:hypothetical protein